MATISGVTIEQKTVTVANTDTDINDAIAAQGADGWLVVQLLFDGTNMVILFSRSSAPS